VQAAGAVPRRNGGVLIIHRPKYDDWTFPKGKLEEGETHEQAAVRELEEESGWQGDLGAELGPSRYTDGQGRDKAVRWWEVWVRDRQPWEPNEEVDDLMWVPLSDVDSFLTYETDRKVAEEVRTAQNPRP
jgi:8-oxo-dGTP pyrophosphatase MutT (NUDIX family)